jgi:hypothetical protein
MACLPHQVKDWLSNSPSSRVKRLLRVSRAFHFLYDHLNNIIVPNGCQLDLNQCLFQCIHHGNIILFLQSNEGEDDRTFHTRLPAHADRKLSFGQSSEASRLVMKYTPEIPLWVQLPIFPEESMVEQFLPGMPAVTRQNDKVFIQTDTASFDEELLAFFEEYMAVSEDT